MDGNLYPIRTIFGVCMRLNNFDPLDQVFSEFCNSVPGFVSTTSMWACNDFFLIFVNEVKCMYMAC